jgi:Cd2+/Zn2+-exporting ATPase
MIKQIQSKTNLAVNIVNKASNEVNEGVIVINDAGNALENIIEQVKKANSKIQDITKKIDTVAKNSNEVVQMVDGVLKTVPAREIRPGDRFIVRVGDRIPIDGVIDSGSTSLDKSLLTGESDPVLVGEGDAVIAGTLNKSGVIEVVASATLEKSYTSRMLELVEEGTLRKSSKERFITRFSRIYTPFVILIAASVAIFPPLLFGGTISEWLHRALILLVISCPCALVISVPLSYFIGIGKASREGILFKGSNYLESLGKVDSIFFDKTGTEKISCFWSTTWNMQLLLRAILLILLQIVSLGWSLRFPVTRAFPTTQR